MHGPCAGTGPPPAHGLHWAARTPRLGYGASCPGTPPGTAPESSLPAPPRPVTEAGATNGPSAAGYLRLHCRGCSGSQVTSSTKLSPGRHGISCPYSAGREGPPLWGRARGPSPRTVSTQGWAGPHRLTWPLRHTARPSRVSREWVCGQPRSPPGGGERPGTRVLPPQNLPTLLTDPCKPSVHVSKRMGRWWAARGRVLGRGTVRLTPSLGAGFPEAVTLLPQGAKAEREESSLRQVTGAQTPRGPLLCTGPPALGPSREAEGSMPVPCGRHLPGYLSPFQRARLAR